MKKNIFIFIGGFLYVSAILVVILTAWVKGFENLLSIATKENGFFESIGALLLFLMAFIGTKWIYQNRKSANKFILLGITIFSCIFFLASMEEISWGQHLFHFDSSEFFQVHNQQHETNFHNLISANLFSSIVYFSVYSFYVFIPLFMRLLNLKLNKFDFLMPYLPPLHVVLIVLFASSFQVYFYDDFGTWADMVTLIIGMILFIVTVIITKEIDKKILIHFCIVTFCMVLFMFSYKIFNFFNAQYEIRETFVVLATFIYFTHLLMLFTIKPLVKS